MIEKNNNYNVFVVFILSHLMIWTLVPTLTNINLPLDTIEALAWGSNLDWGFEKHPPMSAFFVEIFYRIFGSQDWSYYLLSQICVITAFIFIWKFSVEYFNDQKLSLFSIFLLEGIYFYNFTTPEFNVNVCQLPFWAGTVYFAWKSFKTDKTSNWILFGVFAAFGFISKYLFLYLLLSIKLFFIYQIYKTKKFNLKYLIPSSIFIIIISPHLYWLLENNFVTIDYALKRTGAENNSILSHFLNPIIFILKQIGILIPMLIMFLLILKRKKFKKLRLDSKTLFLILINWVPITLILLTSILTGGVIRTMWMTPFYLFIGLFLIHMFKTNIEKIKLKIFFSVFLFLFIFSPTLYFYISIVNEFKRTDYPGKEISNLVQRKWDRNFSNQIMFVVGDEWSAGNLSYHLDSRPKWFNTLEDQVSKISTKGGIVYTGNPKILEEICPGVFGTIKPYGYCMIGKK
tara:strand:+ start:737 stop:2110 length:1374 start_codon:yes stop_codon:yes gene_type:complete